MDFEKEIIESKTIADIFEIVREVVREYLSLDQAGLMVGISDLGSFENGFVGAFYSMEANTIVINKRPLARLLQTNPALYKYYLFYIMLHEYIHSIGCYDENVTRQLVNEISGNYFGSNHIITQLSSNMQKFIPNLLFPYAKPPQDISIEFVKGIDRKNTNYIN